MAAPPEVTLRNLYGEYVMNKSLSDDTDSILAMQGVGWLTRKAIGLATITLRVKEYVDDKGVIHIDIDQTASGGLKGTSEKRSLDWVEAEHDDYVFGKVRGKSRFIKLEDVSDSFLKKGWLPEMNEGEAAVQSYVESVGNGWIANQIWGFEDIKGQRRYVRHVVVTKKDQRKQARLVYDYKKLED